MVTELSMDLVGAKRMEEPEHGGLIYFLRSSDDRVIVLSLQNDGLSVAALP